MRGILLTA
ncbi:hypothetical protein S7711_11601 [Stachybotrys chartarum IBT 7711]|uniref:Uncharacterized protein n=1 Tax=Stachybotrys chartarum (strain CBS 109288 / IBT 7711) TaxID=1280523 RepID=A0A084B8H4_STACB|nr:hypothetical protein S7711_11601 [Stachybotrys chartarum IBT 7711]